MLDAETPATVNADTVATDPPEREVPTPTAILRVASAVPKLCVLNVNDELVAALTSSSVWVIVASPPADAASRCGRPNAIINMRQNVERFWSI